MTVGLVLSALTLGFRHGVDWDHIAAIADLASSAESRRRGFVLSVIYALGHGLVVFALGTVAIVVGLRLPAAADDWMGTIVGLTLVAMGVWIMVDLVRNRRNFRLRSRWILVLQGTFSGIRRVRDASNRRRVVIEHEHEHEHVSEHSEGQAHDHAHTNAAVPSVELVAVPAHRRLLAVARWSTHRHRHEHDLSLASGGSVLPGNGTAAGVGILHGIGFESPTQIAIFVASTSVVGKSAGFVLLAAWVIGLLLANSALAAVAGFGLLHADRNFAIYAGVAVTVGVVSVAIGASMVFGAVPVFGTG